MPDLYHSLLGHDLGHLRIVAELWGVEIKSNVTDPALKELSAALLDPGLIAEVINSLSPEARDGLRALVEAGGRIPWATFIRQHGDVREMGAAKRDRERPYLEPASATEALFYHALLARAFFATDKGPQEFAYIPDNLLPLLNRADRQERKEQGEKSFAADSQPLGRAAAPSEKVHLRPADDSLLDDATTLLAALRRGYKIAPSPKLDSILSTAGLLKKGIPQTEKVRSFLEAPRHEALQTLIEAWRASDAFDELRLIPNLICEGKWINQPLTTRRFLLKLLDAIPSGKWWSLISFISAIKEKYPDFQRPAGDYDSWFIKRASDGQYLRGFNHWGEVDGALVRFFITDILHWLGRLDLAAPDKDSTPTAFRLTASEPHVPTIENGKLKIFSNGHVTAPRLAPRAVRYQLARFCDWDAGRVAAGSRYTPSELLDQRRTETRPDEYRYHLTPKSLSKAREQDLKVEQLLMLLAKHADAGIPPALVKALKRWEANGTEARTENQVVLRVGKPEILEELRKSKAARFLGEPLGPTAVVIKAGAQSKVMNALAEMGLLAEDSTNKTSEV